MGSRAGIIVIERIGEVELYYDHWAAQTLAQDAALAGPDATLARVRSMLPMGVSTVQEWMGAAWAEGAMLIDMPNQRLVWSEEGEALVAPRIMNHLLEQTWPGWTGVWSPEDVHGVIRLAGADPTQIFRNRSAEERRDLRSNEWFAPGSDQLIGEPISVTLEDGRKIIWRTDADFEDIACYGAEEVVAFARGAINAGADGDGWGTRWKLPSSDGSPSWAERGVHIDAQTRTIYWWTTFEVIPCDLEFARYWPGWTLVPLGDACEEHERMLGGIKLRAPWVDLIEQARERFEQMLVEGPRENPFVKIAGALSKEGHEVEPGPTVLQHVPAEGFGRAQTIFDALRRLGSSRLPPVRFVDMKGVIHNL